MRKLVLLFAFAFWVFTIGLMISNDSNAQSSNDPTVTEIKTHTPVLYFIYEKVSESGEELGTVEIQVYDRMHQFVSFDMDRVFNQSKGIKLSKKGEDKLIKLINMPEVGALAFRQAETLEELDRAVDGLSTLIVRERLLRSTARIVYK